MNRKQLRGFVRNRAATALKRLSDAFFLQKCMGGYKYREQLHGSTDIEIAAALVESEREINATLADLIALQAVVERSRILGAILMRRHKRMVAYLDLDAAEIEKARRLRKAEKQKAAALVAAAQKKPAPTTGAHGGGPA